MADTWFTEDTIKSVPAALAEEMESAYAAVNATCHAFKCAQFAYHRSRSKANTAALRDAIEAHDLSLAAWNVAQRKLAKYQHAQKSILRDEAKRVARSQDTIDLFA